MIKAGINYKFEAGVDPASAKDENLQKRRHLVSVPFESNIEVWDSRCQQTIAVEYPTFLLRPFQLPLPSNSHVRSVAISVRPNGVNGGSPTAAAVMQGARSRAA
jgi:hypothetical protein